MSKKMLLAVIFLTLALSTRAADVREKLNIDFDWRFTLSDDVSYSHPDYDDAAWQQVQLPHDWSITMPFDERQGGQHAHLPGGTGWYRRTIDIPANLKGRRIGILFDGIFHQSDVYLNGHHLGFRPYGFGYIDYDLTPYINYGGQNTIAVRVDHEQPSEQGARWYTGSGIYRHAWLTLTQPVHVATYGTYVTTRNSGEVCVQTTVSNDGERDANVSIEHRVLNAQGRQVALNKAALLHLQSGTSRAEKRHFVLNEVHLWSVDDPYLYTLKTVIRQGGRVIDEYSTTFGVREIEFSPTQGFLLNGQRLKLKGLCLHQDDGCLGTAVPDRAYERRLEILKEYGCNALRMSHNQPSPELLDLCDRMGFLVIDEALDKWKSGYYDKYFDAWWQHDILNMLTRDRNHPSIILWSIGNELQEAWDETGEGVRRAEMLRDFVHEQEPTRPVNLAAQNNHNGAFSAVADVSGYNYLEERMISDHRRNPQQCFLVTEELPYYRGAEGNIRSYDENNPWNAVAEHDWIAGGFIWVGVDYLGEAGWPSHGWPNGLFDITMHEKPRAAFHRAMWSDRPHVGLAVMNPGFDLDHGRDLWQWPNMADHWSLSRQYDGQVMEVRTTTNCDRVELWLNGKQMGSKLTRDFPNHTIKWNIPFQRGRLMARAFRDDDLVDSCSIVSAYTSERLLVKPDRTELKADGQDLSFIALELTDRDGHPVQVDDRLVTVTVEGPARLRGVDSGDLRRNVPFGTPALKTWQGRAQAVVQTTREAGTIRVRVHVDGFDNDTACELHSK